MFPSWSSLLKNPFLAQQFTWQRITFKSLFSNATLTTWNIKMPWIMPYIFSFHVHSKPDTVHDERFWADNYRLCVNLNSPWKVEYWWSCHTKIRTLIPYSSIASNLIGGGFLWSQKCSFAIASNWGPSTASPVTLNLFINLFSEPPFLIGPCFP